MTVQSIAFLAINTTELVDIDLIDTAPARGPADKCCTDLSMLNEEEREKRDMLAEDVDGCRAVLQENGEDEDRCDEGVDTLWTMESRRWLPLLAGDVCASARDDLHASKRGGFASVEMARLGKDNSQISVCHFARSLLSFAWRLDVYPGPIGQGRQSLSAEMLRAIDQISVHTRLNNVPLCLCEGPNHEAKRRDGPSSAVGPFSTVHNSYGRPPLI